MKGVVELYCSAYRGWVTFVDRRPCYSNDAKLRHRACNIASFGCLMNVEDVCNRTEAIADQFAKVHCQRSTWFLDASAWTAFKLCAGSCRLPGNAQGLYSFRPTIGCYNFSDGLQPYQLTRDTVGEPQALAWSSAKLLQLHTTFFACTSRAK